MSLKCFFHVFFLVPLQIAFNIIITVNFLKYNPDHVTPYISLRPRGESPTVIQDLWRSDLTQPPANHLHIRSPPGGSRDTIPVSSSEGTWL